MFTNSKSKGKNKKIDTYNHEVRSKEEYFKKIIIKIMKNKITLK